MKFPDSYFEDEVREGFYVPGMMKRAWAAQMEVLEAVSNVCRKHKIPYFADWGTLLGAVRHGGMIPWDDDVDICMKRKDYERFLDIAEKELPEGYQVFSYRNRETDNIVSQIVSYSDYIISNEDLPLFHGYPYATSIDLFVLDFLPRDKDAEDAFYNLLCLLHVMHRSITEHNMTPDQFEHAKKLVEKICEIPFDEEKPMLGQLMRAMHTVAAHFHEETSDEMTVLTYYVNSQKSYRFSKECYNRTVEIPFENMTISVPVGYDELLHKKYRFYMNPIKGKTTHEYPAYKIIHRQVQKAFKEKKDIDLDFFSYRFSRQEMEEAERERIPRETLQAKVMGFLPLFREAHKEIRQMLGSGDVESAMQILGECQNVAIQLGTMIEEECEEGHATVHILERYCEIVFHLHEKIGAAGNIGCGQIMEELVGMEERLAESAQRDIQVKKEVVFVPYKVACWGAMESVWQAAMEDEDTDVYVIPAPYYYKDDFGRAKKDEPQYETKYPDHVAITSYEEYNFEVHHPDKIVIQCPFDEYNYGLTIHPFFYARNLKKYTDCLVFIQPFVMDEIQPDDGRGRVTLRYLCNTPGVVHADQVIVQSEQMKEVYVELLTEFAGEETKKMWQEKILGCGSPVRDQTGKDPIQEIVSGSIPQEWKEKILRQDGTRKRIILCFTSVSVFFSYGDQAADQMQEVFRTFSGYSEDIVVWWRPDPKMREVLRKTKPGVLQQYRELIQRYQDADWLIYDESQDVERAVSVCDAYYGDAGSLANECREQKKPVMFRCIKK